MNSPIALKSHVKKECIIGFFANMLINGGIGYYSFRDVVEVAPWGLTGFVFDLAVTGFTLSLVISFLTAWIHHRKRHRWTLSAPVNFFEKSVDRLPHGIWRAGLCIGLFGTVIALIIASILLALDVFISISGVEYAGIKGLAMGGIAALIVPMVIRRGLNFSPENYLPTAARDTTGS